jgi:hypothetical protein
VASVGKVGWLDAVTTPGNKLDVVGTTEDVGADGEVAEVASVVEVVAPEIEVVVVTAVVSKGKAIDPALTEVPCVTGTLVVVTAEEVLEGVVFLFFLADGFATGLRTTRTWVDALAEIATLISMGTRTSLGTRTLP